MKYFVVFKEWEGRFGGWGFFGFGFFCKFKGVSFCFNIVFVFCDFKGSKK